VHLNVIGVLSERLAVGERRERRAEGLASLALLDLGEHLEEPLSALGHAPVDLRVGPAGDFTDLGV
jgi:hypothetical protein